ncbi:hypothetical protein [Mesorhizobium sp.]|uniref:hypothetical protein n=1 Tax=Mesorhizobium sp. TaxID=1871066 RepID=UPI000FE3C953|nr:hypothetical protein [Mesorhizobium sp.]RWI35436.1 MAG: hypothetical protein EOR14_28455 [Mesorhizobium sp.]RWJ03373.1 MAG: hypothetical protein EOR24_31840 [Mesorhizobium sp.]RWJ66395.1 MAG: hypothetical protein EOR34_28680 [Mesorhizobium sp.]
MPKNDETGFTVTPTKTSFLLTLIAILGIGWQGVSYVKAQEQHDIQQDGRLQVMEKAQVDYKAEIKDLTKAIVELKEQVVRLTTVYETNKRAQLDFGPSTLAFRGK